MLPRHTKAKPHPPQTNTPRSIVFIECASGMGGVQHSTLYLAQHLDRAHWHSVVICPEEGELPQACRRASVPVCIVPRPKFRSTSFWFGIQRRLPNPLAWLWNLWALLVAAYQLVRSLRQIQPDLIVTKGLPAHFYGGLAAYWSGIACIWHVQDFISERFGGLYRQVFGYMATWLPTAIIVDGEAIARQLPTRLQAQVELVYNGVDTTLFRPGRDGLAVRQELGIPAHATVVGHVARLTPWKGQHYLLESFARLAAACPDTYLLFVGSALFDNDTYERRLRHLTATLGLTSRVIFAGYRHDLPNALAAMDVFIYPSVEKDTTPLALLSAMAAGLPIVAFNIEGTREVLGEDEAGLLTSVGQEVALAQAMARMLADTTLRQSLAHKARQRAVAAFSLDQHVLRMASVFLRTVAA